MRFNIKLQTKSSESQRISEVLKDFDMTFEQSQECFEGDIDIDNKEWSIGLIVGSSGSGKSTIAKELFPEHYVSGYSYSAPSVVDDMPGGGGYQKDRTHFYFGRFCFSSFLA